MNWSESLLILKNLINQLSILNNKIDNFSKEEETGITVQITIQDIDPDTKEKRMRIYKTQQVQEGETLNLPQHTTPFITCYVLDELDNTTVRESSEIQRVSIAPNIVGGYDQQNQWIDNSDIYFDSNIIIIPKKVYTPVTYTITYQVTSKYYQLAEWEIKNIYGNDSYTDAISYATVSPDKQIYTFTEMLSDDTGYTTFGFLTTYSYSHSKIVDTNGNNLTNLDSFQKSKLKMDENLFTFFNSQEWIKLDGTTLNLDSYNYVPSQIYKSITSVNYDQDYLPGPKIVIQNYFGDFSSSIKK